MGRFVGSKTCSTWTASDRTRWPVYGRFCAIRGGECAGLIVAEWGGGRRAEGSIDVQDLEAARDAFEFVLR